MAKPRTRTTRSPARDAAPATNDVTAVLLDVLRNVNREVQTALELSAAAQAAVDHFRAISISLRTLADLTNSLSTGPSQGAAPLAEDH